MCERSVLQLTAACLAMAVLPAAAGEAAPPPPIPLTTTVENVYAGNYSVRYLYIRPTLFRPTVGVILFAGGQGRLGIDTQGAITNTGLAGNFLVRERNNIARKELAVAVVDTPNSADINGATRISKEHADTYSAVIADFRSKSQAAKIWLVGTSFGTLSVANIAARYPLETSAVDPTQPAPSTANHWRPNGVVLTSPAMGHSSEHNCNYDLFGYKPASDTTSQPIALNAINVPAYVLTHVQDTCPCTARTQASLLLSKLTKSPAKARLEITRPAATREGNTICMAFTPHGYYTVESDAVTAIANWVK